RPEARVWIFSEAGHERAIIPLGAAGEGRGQLLADTVHLALGQGREEGQRQRVGRGGFGDGELALAVAELAQVGEEVDAGQVGLAGDALAGEPGDRRVAVDL